MAKDTQEIAKGDVGSLAMVVHDDTSSASLDKLDEILLTGELNVEIVDDPNEISKQIVAQLLSAKDDAELQNLGNATGWSELFNIPMELHGFRWQRSTFEGEGAPVYFVVKAKRLDTGEPVTLTTGSMNVLAQLSNLARRGALVGSVWMLTQAETETRRGYRPFWLVQPEGVKKAAAERAEQAAAPAAAS